MYKMNYRYCSFLGGRLFRKFYFLEGRLLERDAYWRGALIGEWGLIRSFTVLENLSVKIRMIFGKFENQQKTSRNDFGLIS